jgi:hypothetical protein
VTKRLRGGLVLTAAVLAAGCGSHAQTQRPAVAKYVTQVNRVESTLTTPLSQVTRAGAAFATQLRSGPVTEGPLVNSAEQTLEGALTKIRAAQVRLALLPAPVPARHLRSLLLALTAGEASMTDEITRLVDYLPHFDAALAGLGPAAVSLEHVLSRTATGQAAVNALYASKAAALRRFDLAVGLVLTRLRRLQPPAVSKPGYTAELASLKGMASSAGGLATALTSGSLGKVDPLLLSFDKAATESHSRAVQRAQIAAVRTYDGESAKLTKLQAKIAEERLRLDNYLQ